MATEIKVPTLGESVTTATVARWMKQAGDTVAADEPVVELETDKVTVEVGAPMAGTLSEIIVAAGDEVSVGAVLGLVSAGGAVARPAPTPANVHAHPAANPPPGVNPPPTPSGPVARPATPPSDIAALPAATKLMADRGVTSEALGIGTGKDGRITKGDVLDFLARPAAAPAAAPAAKAPRTPAAGRLWNHRIGPVCQPVRW